MNTFSWYHLTISINFNYACDASTYVILQFLYADNTQDLACPINSFWTCKIYESIYAYSLLLPMHFIIDNHFHCFLVIGAESLMSLLSFYDNLLLSILRKQNHQPIDIYKETIFCYYLRIVFIEKVAGKHKRKFTRHFLLLPRTML